MIPSTTIRRVQKGTIFVQPESVKRREYSFKGRKALPQGKSFQKRWLPEKGNIKSLKMSKKMSLPVKSISKQFHQQLATQLQLKVRNWILLERKKNFKRLRYPHMPNCRKGCNSLVELVKFV